MAMIDPAGRPLPDAVQDAASDWFARRQRQRDAVTEAAFERWLQEDPLHRIAYGRLEAAWQQSDVVASGELARNRSLPRAPFYQRPSGQVAALAVAGAVVLSIGFATSRNGVEQLFSSAPAEAAFYQTDIGEVRSIRLSNGSSMILDTRTRVRMRSADQVLLETGRLRIIAPQGVDPMHVQVAGSEVTGSDVTFDVDAASRPARVISLRGAVAIRNGADPPVKLGAGNEIALASGADARRASQGDVRWVEGMVAFDATPLDDAVAALNRYNRVQIQLADQSLGAKRVSGAFKATDPSGFVAALAALYPLRIDRSAADRIVLAPRR